MTIRTILLSTLVLFLAACGQSAPEPPAGDQAHAPETGLHLNQGERWVANPETTEGVHNMLALLEEKTGVRDSAKVAALGEVLSAEFQLIFQRCTMKGEAHDQLHHFLQPLQPMIQSVKKGEAKQLPAMRAHLQTYETYFK